MVGTKVYLGGLPYGVTEKDLERFFKGYGRIRDVLIKNGYGFCEFDDYRDADDAVYELNGKELLGERVIVEHARGTARRDRSYGGGGGGGGGYGRRRSSWMDKVSVEKARGTPRGSDIWRGRSRSRGPAPRRRSRPRDKDMDVRIHDRYGPPTRTEYRLIVENLSSRVSWQDLKDYMRQAGEVTYADAHKQRRNEGVVEFATHSDMRNAIDKLDDTELNGRRIRLIEDSRRGRGRRSRSSSSRSRSRSRSRSGRRRTRTRSRSRRSSRSRSRRSSRSKSKSRGRSKSRGHTKSASRSKSRSHSKSKSREPSKSKSKSRSRSRSRSQSESKALPKSRSQSHTKAKSQSKDRSQSRSVSKDRSKSKSRSRSKSETKDEDDDMSPKKD